VSRPRTISDDKILAVARKVFRTQGHAATTREIAEKAGISEGVLYQRFASKDELFFAAMAPSDPHVEELIGPGPGAEDGARYLKHVLVRLADYFAEVIPLGLHIMMHPSFDRAHLDGAQAGAGKLEGALAKRLAQLETSGELRKGTAARAAQMIVGVAHNAGIPGSWSSAQQRSRDLEAMAELMWSGLGPSKR
jgi:AcrR family transcriptional regulator